MMKAFDRLVNAGCDAAQARPINRVIRLSNISALTGAASYLFYAVYYTGLMQLQEMNNSLTMAGVEKYLANASK